METIPPPPMPERLPTHPKRTTGPLDHPSPWIHERLGIAVLCLRGYHIQTNSIQLLGPSETTPWLRQGLRRVQRNPSKGHCSYWSKRNTTHMDPSLVYCFARLTPDRGRSNILCRATGIITPMGKDSVLWLRLCSNIHLDANLARMTSKSRRTNPLNLLWGLQYSRCEF